MQADRRRAPGLPGRRNHQDRQRSSPEPSRRAPALGLSDHTRPQGCGLKNRTPLTMARALEVLDQTVRQIERGEITALDAIDLLLAEELTLRQNRRVKMALMTARITAVKTLAGFDFAFQPSLDRNRILTLAQLDFIDRHEA